MQEKLKVYVCRRYGHDPDGLGALFIAAYHEGGAEKIFREKEGGLSPCQPEQIKDVFAVGNPRVLHDYSF